MHPTAIHWTDFTTDTPKLDENGNDPAILVATKTTAMFGMTTFDYHVSDFRTGNGCFTNRQGDYVSPTSLAQGQVFWAYLNPPTPTDI